MQRQFTHLEELLPAPEEELRKKYQRSFDTQARYMGNGVYMWAGIYATDTRELWLKGLLGILGIEVDEEDE